MPAPTERETLIAKRKRLEQEAKDLPGSPAAQNPDNIASGAIQKKLDRYVRYIAEIDARLEQISNADKKK